MEQLIDEVKRVIIEGLHLEELTPADIGPEDPLFGDAGLGLDSVDALELVLEVERNFGVMVQDSEEGRKVLRSVASLAAFIQQNR